MALTREFRETVYDRAQHDSKFRKALLTEAVNAYLNGDEGTGQRDYRIRKAGRRFEKAEQESPSHAGPERQSQHGELFRDSPGVAEKSRHTVDGEGSVIQF